MREKVGMFHMKQLMKWRPLILEPNVALIWTVGWLNLTTIIQKMNGPVLLTTEQLVEAVVMLSAVVLIADVYNLILIYQQSPAIIKTPVYRSLSLLFAVIMICLLVLAWGNPSQVLLPQRVNWMNLLFLMLAGGKAYLGDFFSTTSRLMVFPPQHGDLLWSGTSLLLGQGLLIYPLVTLSGHLRWLLIILVILAMGISLLTDWRQVAHLLNDGFVQRSSFYQGLIGCHFTSALAVVFFGLDTIIFRMQNHSVDLITFVFVFAWWLMGISMVILEAMQRYDNDYRYGHAVGYERLYLLLGGIATVIIMLLTAWLVAMIH